MKIEQAISCLYNGNLVSIGMKLPEWGGYWFIGSGEKLQVMTKDGKILDTPDFKTYGERDDWEICTIDDALGNINNLVKICDTPGEVSDGYHTFDELYEHRYELYLALCRQLHESKQKEVWYSLKHSDGTMYDGWFILGIGKVKGAQISYHLPVTRLKDVEGFELLSEAPEFDGHTSDDVLKRLNQYI